MAQAATYSISRWGSDRGALRGPRGSCSQNLGGLHDLHLLLVCRQCDAVVWGACRWPWSALLSLRCAGAAGVQPFIQFLPQHERLHQPYDTTSGSRHIHGVLACCRPAVTFMSCLKLSYEFMSPAASLDNMLPCLCATGSEQSGSIGSSDLQPYFILHFTKIRHVIILLQLCMYSLLQGACTMPRSVLLADFCCLPCPQ